MEGGGGGCGLAGVPQQMAGYLTIREELGVGLEGADVSNASGDGLLRNAPEDEGAGELREEVHTRAKRAVRNASVGIASGRQSTSQEQSGTATHLEDDGDLDEVEKVAGMGRGGDVSSIVGALM